MLRTPSDTIPCSFVHPTNEYDVQEKTRDATLLYYTCILKTDVY